MKKRITVTFSVIIILITLMSGLFSYFIFQKAYYVNTENNLTHNLSYVNNILMPEFIETGKDDALEEYAHSTQQRISIISPEGNVVFESTEGREVEDNHLNRPEIQKALKGETATEIRFSDTIQKKMLYVAMPYYTDSQLTYIVRIALPLDIMDDVSLGILNNLLFIACLSILISIVVFSFLLANETKPLYEAAEFARRIARGDYKGHLAMIREKDRIGDLVDSLNQMADQLDLSFSRLNRRNTELASVLSSMDQGIIAIDNENKIILINDAARSIFRIPMNKNVKGCSILEIYREPFVFELQEKLAEDDENHLDYETQIDEAIYKVTSTKIIDKISGSVNGIMIIMNDVTVIKNLENIRKDFVSNVSHELKTPITTIKGFIETIQENDITDKATLNHFYSIISEESDRLTRLVGDILTLSHLENKQTGGSAEAEILSVEREVQKIFDMLKMAAENKKIRLLYTGSTEQQIRFNPDNFRQMMLNLIDNAVKYSDGEGFVKVDCWSEHNNIHIKVSDNGCGIPEKDLPRIFERFYRVDKSRSQANGGTGLGLAIVKHIVQNNHGKIDVTSEPGKGTTFLISFTLEDSSD